MVQLSINKSLLPLKAQFFLWNAGTAPIVPFLTTYARQLGYSSFIVGTIYLVLPVMGMLAKPLFGILADRYRCQKLLFLAFQLVTAVSFFIIQFIPDIPTNSQMHLDCSDLTYLKVCNETAADHCSAERVLNEIGHEGVVYCQVSCDIYNSTLLEEECSTWKVPETCKDTNKISMQFEAELSLDHSLVVKSCLYFRVRDVIFPPSTQNYTPICNYYVSTPCNVECQNPVIRELSVQNVNDSEVVHMYQFWFFFALLISSWIGMAVVVSLGDTICFGMLGDHPSLYGRQRLWGAVGWGIFSVIAGMLVDEFSKGQNKKNYTPIFYLMLIMLILDMFASSRLKYSQTKLSASIIKDVGRLVADLRVVIFMLWIITVGLCTGLLWQFLFWHLEDLALKNGCNEHSWIKTLEGLVMGVQCFGGELPFFFLSGKILQKIGHVHAMSLVLLGVAIRFILYSTLRNPWWCLPIELLQGITFGIFYATMTSYTSIVAPPGTEATVQGLVGALFEGIGVSLGSLLGGSLFENYGGALTFQVYGIGAVIMFVLHVIVQYLISRIGPSGIEAKDFDASARYAAPNEAVDILEEEEQQLTAS